MAEPGAVATRDRVVIKRVVTVTWKPGDGPAIQIVTNRRNRRVLHDAALVRADLTYTYHQELHAWEQDADLAAVIPIGTGWSRYPTPAVGSNAPDRLDIARALHEQYRPTTPITLTEQEQSA